MNENLLASLIRILQKQANSIRALTIMQIALSDALREVAERSGMKYEEFERLWLESVSRSEKSEPSRHSYRQDIAKEIVETIDELNLLARQAKENPN